MLEAGATAVALHPYPCLATRQIDHVAAQLATAAVLVQVRISVIVITQIAPS
jgi:hypothetical protein